MPWVDINGEKKKVACGPCIRGHRSSKCEHTDRVLLEVRKPGRPLTSCPHPTGSCSCDRLVLHYTIPKRNDCVCPPQPPGGAAIGTGVAAASRVQKSRNRKSISSISSAQVERALKMTESNGVKDTPSSVAKPDQPKSCCAGKATKPDPDAVAGSPPTPGQVSAPSSSQQKPGSTPSEESPTAPSLAEVKINGVSERFQVHVMKPSTQRYGTGAGQQGAGVEQRNGNGPITEGTHSSVPAKDVCGCASGQMEPVVHPPKNSCCTVSKAKAQGHAFQHNDDPSANGHFQIPAPMLPPPLGGQFINGGPPVNPMLYGQYSAPAPIQYPGTSAFSMPPQFPDFQFPAVTGAADVSSIAAASGMTLKDNAHQCMCGEGCACLGCASHPQNDATLDFVRSVTYFMMGIDDPGLTTDFWTLQSPSYMPMDGGNVFDTSLAANGHGDYLGNGGAGMDPPWNYAAEQHSNQAWPPHSDLSASPFGVPTSTSTTTTTPIAAGGGAHSSLSNGLNKLDTTPHPASANASTTPVTYPSEEQTPIDLLDDGPTLSPSAFLFQEVVVPNTTDACTCDDDCICQGGGNPCGSAAVGSRGEERGAGKEGAGAPQVGVGASERYTGEVTAGGT